jgi:hypothetical protein
MATGTNDVSKDQFVKVEGLTIKSTTGTAVGGAVTVTGYAGKITSESLTTAQNATYTLTITNTAIEATDIVTASITNGTNTQGTPMIVRVTPDSGSLVIVVKNMHESTQALNGTVVISFVALRA